MTWDALANLNLPALLLAPLCVYALILALHLVVPARWVDGYVTHPDTGKPLRYRLNGLRVLAIVIGLYAVAGTLGWLPWNFFYLIRWEMALGACLWGLVFTFAIVLGAPPRKGLLADLYLGRRENPQWDDGRVDAKMFLYLAGAVMLQLNLLSFAAHHFMSYPDTWSPGVLLYLLLFTWFVIDYLSFEEVHLYTYDFFAENVGFKLGWGCLVFYPFFYPVALWATAHLPDPQAPAWLLVAAALIFFAGWTLARGANMQKYWFKRDPQAKAFGLIAPKTLSTNGKQVLVSGFWGLSRHINYLGEILMATGLVLSLGYPGVWAVWLYPLYYVLLLVPRQIDDDRRCAAKYGELWEEYCRRVPSRIVPKLY